MATLGEPEPTIYEPTEAASDMQTVMEHALGHELSEAEAAKLGFDLLEFLDALTGGDDDCRESR